MRSGYFYSHFFQLAAAFERKRLFCSRKKAKTQSFASKQKPFLQTACGTFFRIHSDRAAPNVSASFAFLYRNVGFSLVARFEGRGREYYNGEGEGVYNVVDRARLLTDN